MVEPPGNVTEGQGRIWRWTRQNGPVGPFAAGSAHTDSTRPTTLARRPRPPGSPLCRRSSERSIPTVCSNPKSALDVRRTPEPPTLPVSPIWAPGREQRARDDPSRGTAICSSAIARMLLPATRIATTHRSTAQGPSGLRCACRRAATTTRRTWRRALHRTVVGQRRPATTQCRDFTLNSSAERTQLP